MKLQHSNGFISGRDGNTNQCTLSETDQRVRVLKLGVGLLIARTKIGDFWAEGFYDVVRFLEAVPLATSEFHLAMRHLRNAFNYCEQSELGAATLELRIVRGILQRP